MSFRTWLISKLGGILESTHVNELVEISNNCNKILEGKLESINDEVNWLRSQIQQERDNNKTLQDMIYVKFGITKGQAPTDNIRDEDTRFNPSMKPIGGRMSWTQRKAKLEADDVAAYWKKKQAENEASLREANNVS